MVKKLRKGDQIFCIKSMPFFGSNIIEEGKYYTVVRLNDASITVEGVTFQLINGSSCYFGTPQEYRKNKLEKLNESIL